MNEAWRDFRAAAGFLTILPVARDLELTGERLARSMGFFPAVGLALGLGLVVLDWLLGALVPRPVLDCLLVLVLIVVTGALHLDGIADLLDGLAGGRGDRERTLKIMKDSQVGAVAVVGLVMLLLLKYLSLYHIPPEQKKAALMLMPCAGRWIQVVLAAFCRYLRPEGGTAAIFVDQAGERESLLATGTLLLACVVLFGMKGIFLLFLLGLAAMLLIRYFEIRLGGVTGDVLGAASEMVEVLSLLLVLAVV
ncbi:cobalamin-5'-phosphate synthase [Geothermobacter ehrlichii]|uniref:Adenosylcobinamide-GDP ribazoletransferase n=1 Tax=Geothermobacter ehrlichii TaxID=213224 RepID=A0A5D3WLP3_9BACT|nr:adenosylcobinamide-GDP ribazoletransferase [Geothermobacter ehrlichii]TYO98459.1 cobalamin-5'-phosphate synthase [Geothermobacter ehrlichii]